MSFFNKKEEVLDFQLTEYGKYLLSLGRLKPSYYCFFDDDILYDASAAGSTENQNMIEGRIQSSTPSIKVSPTRTGAETRVNSFVQQITGLLGSNSDPADKVDVFSKVEVFENKGKINAHALGRSSLDTPYDAAWSVQLLSTPQISSSLSYLDDGGFIENIPQINIDMNYKMFFMDWGEGEFEIPVDPDAQPDNETEDFGVYDLELESNDDQVEVFGIPATSLALGIEQNYILLEILEHNTDFEKENFDIEVYHSGSDGKYVQLAYAPTTDPNFGQVRPIENELNIPGNVSYYMDIFVDEEIPDFIFAEHNISHHQVATNAVREPIARDIYESEDEEPC